MRKAGHPSGGVGDQSGGDHREQDRDHGNGSLRVQHALQQQIGEAARQQAAHQPGNAAEHQKLDRENAADAPARGAERFENHHFAHAAETRAGHAGGKNHRAGQNREHRNEADHLRDAIHHALDDLQHVGHVDHGDGGEALVERLLQSGNGGRAERAGCCSR